MNVEVRQVKTAAEQALSEAFAAIRARLPGGAKVAALRDTAFSRFDAEGLPHRRIEEWKYTDLRALMRDAKPLAAPPDAKAKARAEQASLLLQKADVECRRLVFADGVFVPELSDLDGLEAGLTIVSLAQALASGDPQVADALGRVVPTSDPAFALNTAFMGDGAVIRVAAGARLDRPLHLVFAAVSEQPASIFTRSLALIDKGARAMLVESHAALTAECQVNAALELRVGDEAHVDHVKIMAEGTDALHVSTLTAAIGTRSRFNSFVFTTSGAVVRNNLFLRFDGPDTVANIRGASLLTGKQHVDTTLVADHTSVRCQSREMFKSVLDDHSRSIFQGKIIVRPKAQKTDAKMASHALLLSDTAEADNKPELEIFADDVQCGHGATSGALDDDLLFYLKARGIPAKEAEALLIQAFVGEAVEGIEHAGVREALMESVAAWLTARGDA